MPYKIEEGKLRTILLIALAIAVTALAAGGYLLLMRESQSWHADPLENVPLSIPPSSSRGLPK